MTITELLQKGIISKIETIESALGTGFDINLRFYGCGISNASINVVIDEDLTKVAQVITDLYESVQKNLPQHGSEPIKTLTDEELEQRLKKFINND